MHVSKSNLARGIGAFPLLLASLAACANATYSDAYPANSDVAASGANASLAGAPMVVGGDVAGAGAFNAAGSDNSPSNVAGSMSQPASAGGGGSSAIGFGGSSGAVSAAGGSVSSAGQAGAVSSTTGSCTAPAWVPNMVYRMGDKATKSGKEYTAAYYTMADPEQHCCGNGQDWASSVACP